MDGMRQLTKVLTIQANFVSPRKGVYSSVEIFLALDFMLEVFVVVERILAPCLYISYTESPIQAMLTSCSWVAYMDEERADFQF